MHGLSSWSELAPDRDALRGDAWYSLCCWLACGLFAAFFLRPGSLEVAVRLGQPAPPGVVVHATLTPVSVDRPRGPPSSRRRSARCELRDGACRLSFRWSRRDRPFLPERSVLRLTEATDGGSRPLGEVQVSAPTWGASSRVSCRAGPGCTAAGA